MAAKVFAPTREEMAKDGLGHVIQVYLEDLDNFNTESIQDEESILNLLASVQSLIGLFISEIYELKKVVNSIQEEGA